ncbi:uncharacterized protein BT62DRAFT_845874, partial [Guyanagaster necrorhizus]
SIFSLFPEVEVAIIMMVIQYDLHASDIYKLNLKHRDKTERKTPELNSTKLKLSNVNAALKEYKTLNSIIDPLSMYFSILIIHAQPSGKSALLGIQLFHYTAHLLRITSEYKWHAVVLYHMAFFTKYQEEMMDRDYARWSKIDLELQGKHLFLYYKAKVTTS